MTTVLQVSLYGLIILASVILSLAEGTGFPNSLTIPFAVLSLFLTERWQLFELRTRWANLLGLSAFGWAAWEFMGDDIEARLLSLAHLLVYLTWVVLFMPKTPRLYWTMCALAILHVSVGAVLTTAESFGALTMIFLLAAIWTLSVFSLERARKTYADVKPIPSQTPTTEQLLSPPSGLPSSSVPRVGTWCWNHQSRSVNTAQIDLRLRWISWPFGGGVVVNLLLSSMIGTLFFFFTPRIWIGNFTAFGDTPDKPLRLLETGFAEEVQLGDIGQILEGTKTVMEVRLIDQQTGAALDIEEHAQRLGLEEPLFRGSVLGEYEAGRWRAGTTGERDGVRISPPAAPTPDSVRQEFRVQPMESDILFALPPHTGSRVDHKHSHVFERRLTSVLYREDSISSREALNYVVFSERSTERNPQQRPIGAAGSWLYTSERDHYRNFPSKGLDRLKALAVQVSSDNSDGLPSTPEVMAMRLERYLRSSGQFSYTLDMAIDDRTIDAVEDFLFNRRKGHCEYFASALALMMRAVDIPARMVSGFKGGDFNAKTGYWLIQQRHAHVWVEAYLDRQWLVFEATPASRSDSVKSLAPKSNLWTTLKQFFTDTWSHHVVGMNMAEQNNNLYTPLKEWFSQVKDELTQQAESLTSDNFGTAKWKPTMWIGLLSGLFLIGNVIALRRLLISMRRRGDSALLGRFGQAIYRFARWLFPNDPSTTAKAPWRSKLAEWWSNLVRRWQGDLKLATRRVEFYERFLRLLRSAGLDPLPTQTAREFVIETETQWSHRLRSMGNEAIPAEIVAQFYRVRFGHEELTSAEIQQIDSWLAEMETEWHRKDRPS